ncbi:DUF3846 domain-containing protein [Arthrobacter bambusae]|uniref:DUF3846 domain-containing protein n=1 Tax=Arthrobacter bambusae TaxID=1338426 RepID=A0AAW8D9K4_9MICC|nr:DUF3846 domain-containing protein [Arthrobacter bambusae]MDP9903148.1 hypothetical protein [Arthrobacter bambusae]MDQ0128858.1 hypothetical protein [Arthrobacter bambusae]MDQ0180199.1 hypothetical protein [Arthrobacter bambusae]
MTIRALRIPVDTEQPLRIVEIPESESLAQLQALVEGYVKRIDLQHGVTSWLNEEGKLTGLQCNPRAQRLYIETYGLADIIVGPAVLTGGAYDQGSTLGLSDAQLSHVDQLLGPFARVRIENTYSDGHESTTEVWLEPPAGNSAKELEDWWQDEVFGHTGDGHGTDGSLGSLLTATVISGPTHLAGQTFEWSD